MKKKITIEFEIDPSDYHGINPHDNQDIKELVSMMLNGEADLPDDNQISILVEEA